MVKVTGKGSIIPLEDKARCAKWQLRVPVGKNHITKKYQTKTRRFEGTKTEAEAELRAFINELESGIRVDLMDVRFAAQADRWLEYRIKFDNIALGTQRKLRYQIKTMNMHLGSIKVVDLDSDTVESFYLALMDGDTLSGKPMSGTSTNQLAVTLKAILASAVKRKIILINPCDEAMTPSPDTAEREALSINEARRLMGLLLDGDPEAHTVGVLLALSCGLRRGEVLGLRWGDYDPEAKCLKIMHSLSEDGREFGSTKTKNSKRTIPLDGETAKRLEDWRGVQGRFLLGLGLPQDNGRAIITSAIGGNMHPANFGRWWGVFKKKHGFEKFSLHQLRHTFATLMVANQVDLVTAKALMGHKDTTMLTEIYAHVVPENLSKATATVGRILHEKKATDNVIKLEEKSFTA